MGAPPSVVEHPLSLQAASPRHRNSAGSIRNAAAGGAAAADHEHVEGLHGRGPGQGRPLCGAGPGAHARLRDELPRGLEGRGGGV